MKNCFSYDLQSTAAWRDRCSEKYPHDTRNYVAAKACRNLAEMECGDKTLESRIEDMSQDEEYAEEFNETKSSIMASIGFYYDPSSPDEVMARFIAALT